MERASVLMDADVEAIANVNQTVLAAQRIRK